jgi:hypothetical protein
MKAKLIKKNDKLAPRPKRKPTLKNAQPGGPAVDPRIAFAALFKSDGAPK